MAKIPEKKQMDVSAPDDEWLAQLTEEIIEPELEIVDAHHHLWIRNGHRYLMPEFADDIATGHNIIATVFAECGSMYRQDGPEELRSLGETEFVTGCAAMADSGVFGSAKICQGHISRVDLTLGERTRDLFHLHTERSGGRFKGIRFTTAWDASDKIANHAPAEHILLDPEVQAGGRVMADLGLTLDCWVYHPQLSDVAALAKAVPDLTIVLNHTGVPILGGPYKADPEQVRADWRRGIQEVASHDNVFIKLGAFPIRRSGDTVDRTQPPSSEEVATAWKPWMTECIEAFGPSRSIFESNFPVQKLWSSYQVTWNAFKRIAASATPSEKEDLFKNAAKAAYRLT